jgi:2-aminoethylphosphonate-pyruvate transaminase
MAPHAAHERRRRLRCGAEQFVPEGGQPARLARYTRNYEALVSGMRARAGFRVFLDSAIQAPIIVTFHAPADPRYDFKAFYASVRERGFILYPGKLTQVETFRVGCIGAIGAQEMRQAVHAIADSLAELGIRDVTPAAPAAIRAA